MKLLVSALMMICVLSHIPDFISAQSFPYQFDQPSAILKLDPELQEISGLSLSKDGEHLLAVQDEKGVIFFLNKEDGRIVKKDEFWKDGDYEGIEAVGDDIFVVKNTGTVYWVKSLGQGGAATEKFNYSLNKSNDVEGLTFDPVSQRLLLACKSHPEDQNDVRSIFSFNIQNLQLIQNPVYTLSLNAIHKFLENNPEIPRIEKVRKFFYEDKKLSFNPSGIAVHPKTNELYLISSKGKMLIVMNRNNEVLYIQKLQKEEHPQPEGLCFDRSGNLFISNEGKDGPATILVYKYPIR